MEVSTDATPFDLPFSRKLVPEAAAWLTAGQISPAPSIKPETKIRLATNMPLLPFPVLTDPTHAPNGYDLSLNVNRSEAG